MPRKLPWLKDNSTTPARQKRTAASEKPAQKRQKSEESEEALPRRRKTVRDKTDLNEGVPASSSPPPEPYSEDFMEEGMDADDRYRMVEDEFLSIAQLFTAHLHAAEYKRQERLAKTRNAETIDSISRPVTGKMPDQTRRKIEAIARSKKQQNVLDVLVGKKPAATDLSDSDGDSGLPYFGTTLHGLMDSPKRKGTSLSMIRGMNTTRAAAGYKKSASQSKTQAITLGSPRPRGPRNAKDDEDTDTSIDIYLDTAPIPAPKLTSLGRKPASDTKLKANTIKKEAEAKASSRDSQEGHRRKPSHVARTTTKDHPGHASASVQSKAEPQPGLSRLARARAQRAKEEKEKSEDNKKPDIPIFL